MINLNPKSSTDFHIPSCLPLNVDIWGQSTPTERYKIMILLSFFSVKPFLSYLIYDFRKGRSTADHLVRFDGYIRNAFAKKEHVIAIFFDLEKAYDTTWKYGLLSDLYDLDFRGHLRTFIDGFLSHRLFQVTAGSTLSDMHEQEMVPGSILSQILFSLKINNIVKSDLKGSEASLFVDYLPYVKTQSPSHMRRDLRS